MMAPFSPTPNKETVKQRLCAVSLGCLLAAPAAGTKTYQVTGPVLDVKDDMIAVQKGKEK